MDVVRQPTQGWIEVIVGSMFSGKSEELIRRLRRAQIAKQRVQIFKPQIDTRYRTKGRGNEEERYYCGNVLHGIFVNHLNRRLRRHGS